MIRSLSVRRIAFLVATALHDNFCMNQNMELGIRASVVAVEMLDEAEHLEGHH